MQTQASFFEAVTGAADSLRSSKLRSFLTLLGIILATTTLIAVMSIINGMNAYIAENVSDMGADGFRVYRMAFLGDFEPKKFLELQKKNPELKPDEFEWVKDHVTLCREFGLETGGEGKVSFAGEQLEGVDLNAGTPNYIAINNIQIASGRMFTENDDSRRREVVVIGSDIKDRFFINRDPTGKTISVDGRPFEVVGV